MLFYELANNFSLTHTLELQENPEGGIVTSRDIFKKLDTKADVAVLLGISVTELNAIYGRHRISSYYETFSIPKKNGGTRLISSPTRSLKYVLIKFSDILTELYNEGNVNNKIAHGFVQHKSIITNAKAHFGHKYLLNLDLVDFFPSITFSRVRGLFMKGLGVGYEAANIMAMLTCYNGCLPQGSPCSPIISNMICRNLDKSLNAFSKKHRIKITRYADDITVSSNDSFTFSKVFNQEELASEFVDLIESNGFKINDEKTRVSYPSNKKEVTGLVINRKINVPRRFVRELRAILHKTSFISDEEKKENFKKIYGRVSYLRQIKSKDDPVFIKYALMFNEVYKGTFFNVNAEKSDITKYVHNRVVLIGYDSGTGSNIIPNVGNGTGFYLKHNNSYYIVTCYHVIHNAIKECSSFRILNIKDNDLKPVLEYTYNDYYNNLDELRRFVDKDLLIFKIKNTPDYYFEVNLSDDLPILNVSDQVRASGFHSFVFNVPNRNQLSIIDMSISSLNISANNAVGKTTIVGVNINIPHGISGGPMLDSNLKLIGIASNGMSYYDEAKGSQFKPGFISLSVLLESLAILEKLE